MPAYLHFSRRCGQRHQSFVIRHSYHIDTDTKCVSLLRKFLTHSIFLKCCLKTALLIALLFGENDNIKKVAQRRYSQTRTVCAIADLKQKCQHSTALCCCNTQRHKHYINVKVSKTTGTLGRRRSSILIHIINNENKAHLSEQMQVTAFMVTGLTPSIPFFIVHPQDDNCLCL